MKERIEPRGGGSVSVHGPAAGRDHEDQPDDGIGGEGEDLQDHEEHFGAAERKRDVLAGLAIVEEDHAMERDGNDGKDDGLDHPLDEVVGRRDRPSPLRGGHRVERGLGGKILHDRHDQEREPGKAQHGHELPPEKAVGRPDGRKHGQACHDRPFFSGNAPRLAALRPIAGEGTRPSCVLRQTDEVVASATRQLRYDRRR